MPRIIDSYVLRLSFGLLILASFLNGSAVSVYAIAECAAPSFNATTNHSLNAAARSFVLGDFDGDGNQDAVVAHHGSNIISVLLGDGTGRYGVANSYPVNPGPYFITAGDFNGDGKLDVATVGFNNNIGSTTGVVSVLLGDGAGGFGPLTSYSVGSSPKFIAAGDFNKDNRLDLVTANGDSSNISVLLGDGAGSFATAVNYPVLAFPRSIAISDFNKDGNLDLVVGQYANLNVSLLLGTGTGAFGTAVSINVSATSTFPTPSTPESVAVGDFNGDGNPDLAASLSGNYPYGVSILLGNGAGAFSAPTFIAIDFPGYVIVGDLNGDGKQDLVVTASDRFIASFTSISLLLGNGSGGFAPPKPLIVGSYPSWAAIGDLNKDGKADLVVVNTSSSDLSILLGDGAGGIGTPSYPEGGTQASYIVSGDFNGDAKPDVAVANSFSNNVSVLLGNGGGAFGAPATFAVGFQPQSLTTGDFNNDGKLDLAVGNNSNGSFSSVSVLLGTGTGGFGAATNYTLSTQSLTQAVATGDLNSDGKLDLVTANKGSGSISILFGQGAGVFGGLTNIAIGPNTSFVAINDLNGDNKLDLAVAFDITNSNSGGVSILLGTGTGTFGPVSTFNVGRGPRFIAVADFNSDGKLDLATANGTVSATVSILLGTGTGSFGPASSITGWSGSSIAVRDFNGDGRLDLALTNTGFPAGPVSVLLGDGTGLFGSRMNYIAGATPLSLVADDFNGDGRPDLAVANYSSATVSSLINVCGAQASMPSYLTINNAIVTEGIAGTRDALFTVTLSAPSADTVTVDFTTLGDSASPVLDFQTVQGQLSFAPGETTKTIVVPVKGDNLREGDEYFSVRLSNPANASLKRQQGLGTIVDDDPIPSITINDTSVTEGSSGTSQMSFNVMLSNPTTQQVTVHYETANGTALQDVDYGATQGTILIGPGITSYTISVPIYGDVLDELNETFTVNLSNPTNAVIGRGQATGNIFDDDPTARLSISDASVMEGNAGTTNLAFNVSLSAASGKTITVNYATANGTATADGDYQTVNGTLTFNPGEVSKAVAVQVNGDATGEPDETFFVNLTTPTNASITDSQGLGTILDDDSPRVEFTQSSYSVSEGVGVLNVIITRTGDKSAPATVKYTTGDTTDVNFQCQPNTVGQLTGVASRKCDYHIAVGTLRFAAGEASKQVALSVVDDVYVEGPETFTLTLSNPTGLTLGQNNTATVTITDDDVTTGAANPIDNTRYFIRQLYVDLLSREPDSAGWNGWTTRIDQCGQPDQPPPPCDRVTVGGDGFLRSGEFFDRQFFVLRLYRTGLGRILRYEDVGDLAYVSGFLTAEELELNKQDLVNEFVTRPEFANRYGPLSNAAFVSTLLETAGVSVPQAVQDGWVSSLDTNSKTRAQVFREVSERAEVSSKWAREAQVVSAYYGFFTRNPDGAYLNYLERLERGEINLADLANAFINAQEYRQRFGQ